MPADAVEPAAKVKVLLPLPGAAILAGVKVAVTPAGTPLMESATAELNPDPAVVVNVMGVDAPGVTVALVALAASVKLPGCETVRANFSVLVVLPPTAPRVRL